MMIAARTNSTRIAKIAELTDYENSFWRTIEGGYIGCGKCKSCGTCGEMHQACDVSTRSSRFSIASSLLLVGSRYRRVVCA